MKPIVTLVNFIIVDRCHLLCLKEPANRSVVAMVHQAELLRNESIAPGASKTAPMRLGIRRAGLFPQSGTLGARDGKAFPLALQPAGAVQAGDQAEVEVPFGIEAEVGRDEKLC